MIETLSKYVQRVSNGEIEGDPKIARLIDQALSVLPASESEGIEKLFAKGVQDIMMVVYLANLTRTHLLLAEKLRDSTPKSEPPPEQQ